MHNADYEKKWLVKSDHKIMGPFSTDILEELLFKRQIALIDEVRDMNQRWMYIREISELKSMAEKVRIELSKKSEETMTMQSGSTATVYQNEINMPSQDISNVPTSFTGIDDEVQDISFNDVSIPKLEIENKKPLQKKFQFVSKNDPKIQTEISVKNNKTIYLISAVVVSILISIVGIYFYKKNIQNKYEQSALMRIRKLTIYGADQKATEAFQKLPEHLQSRILPDILVLFLRLDNEGTINLEETLNLVEKKELNNQQRAQVELIQFNKKIALNEISIAKGHLIAAKDADPDSDIVKENEAILNYLDNQFKTSSEQFLNLFNSNNKGRHLFGMALNHLKEPSMSDNQLIEKIERYLSTRIEFKKELTFIRLYLGLKNENSNAIKNYTLDFLNTPVQLSSQFKIPGLVFSSIYKFDKIILYYEKIKQQLDPKLLALIELHLFLEKGDGYSAQKQYDSIQGRLSILERHNTQIAIQSVLNRYGEALAIEKVSQPAELNTASHLALLRLKKENKNSNFESNMNALKNEKNLISLWAELMSFNDNEYDKIKKFIQLNSTTAEDFLPVIEAKARLD